MVSPSNLDRKEEPKSYHPSVCILLVSEYFPLVISLGLADGLYSTLMEIDLQPGAKDVDRNRGPLALVTGNRWPLRGAGSRGQDPTERDRLRSAV